MKHSTANSPCSGAAALAADACLLELGDGYNTTAPSNNRAVKEGLAVWVARPSQGEVPGLEGFVYTILATNPTYLQANQEILSRFTCGLADGLSLIHSDPARAAKAVHGTIWPRPSSNCSPPRYRIRGPPFAPRMALKQSAFHQNRDFMLRFGEEVKSVEYKKCHRSELR